MEAERGGNVLRGDKLMSIGRESVHGCHFSGGAVLHMGGAGHPLVLLCVDAEVKMILALTWSGYSV